MDQYEIRFYQTKKFDSSASASDLHVAYITHHRPQLLTALLISGSNWVLAEGVSSSF